MDRVSQLRGEAGGSKDSTLDTTTTPNESYVTAADESSKYFSIIDNDSTSEATDCKDVSATTATIAPDLTSSSPDSDQAFLSSISPISKSNDLIDDYKVGTQIEAANILSGGVDIFDDNSYDETELVIDDKITLEEEQSQSVTNYMEDMLIENSTLVKEGEEVQNTEVVLHINGKNVNAIDIGNDLYLYRPDEKELAAVQIINTEDQQPTFKFLKVRENAEGNLEVYEEIVEIRKDVPEVKATKVSEKGSSHLPIKDINKVLGDNQGSSKVLTNNLHLNKETSITHINEVSLEQKADIKPDTNRSIKLNSDAKLMSPVIGSFMPIAFHSTPSKEGVPLTKTMVDLQLHSKRQPDLTLKMIEVNTDVTKIKLPESFITPESSIAGDVISNKQSNDTSVDKDGKDTTVKKIVDEINVFETEDKNIKNLELGDKLDQIISSSVLNKSCDTPTHNDNKTSSHIMQSLEVSVKGNVETDTLIDMTNVKDIKVSLEVEECLGLSTKPNVKANISTEIKSGENVIDDKLTNDDKTIDLTKTKDDHVNENIGKNVIDDKLTNDDKTIDLTKIKDDHVIENIGKNVIDDKLTNDDKTIDLTKTKDDHVNENIIVKNNEMAMRSKEMLVSTEINVMEKPKNTISSKSNSTSIVQQDTSITQKGSKINISLSNTATLNLNNDVLLDSNILNINKTKTIIIPSTIETKKNLDTINIKPQDNKALLINNKMNIKNKIKNDLTKSIDQAISGVKDIKDTSIIVNKNISELIETTNSAESVEKNITKFEFTQERDVLNVKEKISSQCAVKSKLVNNNTAVPFGKWTEANKQEYLNKIKESKTNIVSSSTSQIKQPNDLNRRDVLKKIDTARHNATINASLQKKDFSIMNKVHPKTEISKPTKFATKEEVSNIQTDTNKVITDVPKVAIDKVTEMYNQDLIDKTIEGILMDKPGQNKPSQDMETKLSNVQESYYDNSNPVSKSVTAKPLSLVDDIEQKMNELHGIPFVERPGLKLPQKFNQELYHANDSHSSSKPIVQTIKTNSKIPNLLPLSNTIHHKVDATKDRINDDSDEEILEQVPITGDSEIKSYQATTSTLFHKLKSATDYATKKTSQNLNKTDTGDGKNISPTITEKEFDKFARRNSVTCENQISINVDNKQQQNVVKTVAPNTGIKHVKKLKSAIDNKSKYSFKPLSLGSSKYSSRKQPNKSTVHPIKSKDGPIKSYKSKLQMAYKSALSAKRRNDSPISLIDDKPVKVIYMETSSEFSSNKQNFPEKQQVPNICKIAGDLGNSDVFNVQQGRVQDAIIKPKLHQRKQVLTPVETSDLELIQPTDLGIPVAMKKKRNLEDYNKVFDEPAISKVNTASYVPKKSYLLGRNEKSEKSEDLFEKIKNVDEKAIEHNIAKEPHEQLCSHIPEYSNSDKPTNTIDSLVMAAELLEKEPDVAKAIASTQKNSPESSQDQQPKRGRGRPRKYPLRDIEEALINIIPTDQEHIKCNKKVRKVESESSDLDSSDDDGIMIKENWSMGKINENILCPICNKLFRSENVVFKHVKHCTGTSPNRSISQTSEDSYKRDSLGDKKSETEENDEDIHKIQRNEEHHKLIETPIRKTKKINIAIKKSENDKCEEFNHQSQNKPLNNPSSLECEVCGKTFRQLSYLVNHKLIHKKEIPKKSVSNLQGENDTSVFSCDVCHKKFRKLHHVVQHRLIHKPPLKLQNKGSTEKSVNKISDASDNITKDVKDNSSGFRCEQCDKSFRKLHHLVEHRETHDGINRLKNMNIQSPTVKPSNSTPQCLVCKKTFRKLHHLSEHKEQHLESNKLDNKKGLLNDIIHECSLCYMVFPNEHSLNKHTVICQKKKRQSALKQNKETLQPEGGNLNVKTDDKLEAEVIKINDTQDIIKSEEKAASLISVQEDVKEPTQRAIPQRSATKRTSDKFENSHRNSSEIPIKIKRISTADENLAKTIVADKNDETGTKSVVDFVTKNTTSIVPSNAKNIIEQKTETVKVKQNIETIKVKQNIETVKVKQNIETVKVKQNIETVKVKQNIEISPSTATKKRKTSEFIVPVEIIDLSDDDDVRYMLNPAFKVHNPDKVFMKVQAKKRNSLQIERPQSKDLIQRKISLQHPPKILRMNSRLHERKREINDRREDTVPSSSSDDGEVKYSFPKTKASKPVDSNNVKTDRFNKSRKSLSDKNKSTIDITKPKIIENDVVKKLLPPKTRVTEVGHRCDCGQLFGSAVLLARHAVLSHTPPRVRKRRSSPPPAVSITQQTIPIKKPKADDKILKKEFKSIGSSNKIQINKTMRGKSTAAVTQIPLRQIGVKQSTKVDNTKPVMKSNLIKSTKDENKTKTEDRIVDNKIPNASGKKKIEAASKGSGAKPVNITRHSSVEVSGRDRKTINLAQTRKSGIVGSPKVKKNVKK